MVTSPAAWIVAVFPETSRVPSSEEVKAIAPEELVELADNVKSASP